MSACFWCRKSVAVLTRDHVTPRGVGGADGPDNVVMACELCNGERGRLVAEHVALARLRTKGSRLARSRARKRNEDMRALQAKWRGLEIQRLGWSPSSRLDLKVPGDRSISRAALNAARCRAESRFTTREALS